MTGAIDILLWVLGFPYHCAPGPCGSPALLLSLPSQLTAGGGAVRLELKWGNCESFICVSVCLELCVETKITPQFGVHEKDDWEQLVDLLWLGEWWLMGQASALRHLEWGVSVTVPNVSTRHCMCPGCWGGWTVENCCIESRVCPPSEKVPFLVSPL